MTFIIHETSNPYEVNTVTGDGDELIVQMGVDQLWIDPDTNEQMVLTEYFERVENE